MRKMISDSWEVTQTNDSSNYQIIDFELELPNVIEDKLLYNIMWLERNIVIKHAHTHFLINIVTVIMIV